MTQSLRSSVLVKFPLDLAFFQTDYTPWTRIRSLGQERIVQDKWVQRNAVYWAKVNCFDFLHVRWQTTCEVFPVGLFYISVVLKSALCHYWALSSSAIPSFFSIQLCIRCYKCIHMWIVSSVSDNQTKSSSICCHRANTSCGHYRVSFMKLFVSHSIRNTTSKVLKKMFQNKYF
jgi:hypothetical protein